jgi:hydroxypyruvate reductase/glycerate 2-kinase
MDMLSICSAEDLVLCVVSGGGSALLCAPHEMECETQVAVISALTVKGATISEMNTVRKHISQVKGGQLAKIIYPATCISLIFSDVPGDDVSMVASGPTVKDTTVNRDAAAVLAKYNVLEMCQLPSCKLLETPKEEKYFANVHNILFVSAKQALAAMSEKAEDLGFEVKIFTPPNFSDKKQTASAYLESDEEISKHKYFTKSGAGFSTYFEGEARLLAKKIIAAAKKGQCLLGAGESTVKIIGRGQGGRNQEMALAALPLIKENQVLVCLASDGRDNTEAAGAIADAATLHRAKILGLNPQNYLENNDSFTFFEETGDQVITGRTGANISDFFVLLES